MKVYFMSSPRGKQTLEGKYQTIYKCISDLGHENVSDFIVTVKVNDFYEDDISVFYKKTTTDLKSAEVCIFEASEPSLAIGQLMSMAIDLGKPIIALYTGDNVPLFLSGAEDEKIQVIQYDQENVKNILKTAIEFASDQMDTRFNFFISPKHQNYLDWISKHRKIPRAVFLRNIIEREMDKDEEFVG